MKIIQGTSIIMLGMAIFFLANQIGSINLELDDMKAMVDRLELNLRFLQRNG